MPEKPHAKIEHISAVTLATSDMARAVRFYQALGFSVCFGGENASFTSLRAGESFLNLMVRSDDAPCTSWGRVIFYVSDVDAFFQLALAKGLNPQAPPQDASWGERYFHICDPEGHELSFAKPLG